MPISFILSVSNILSSFELISEILSMSNITEDILSVSNIYYKWCYSASNLTRTRWRLGATDVLVKYKFIAGKIARIL